MAVTMSGAGPWPTDAKDLDFHLAAELDHPVGRELEEFHRAFGVAKHPAEKLLAPDRHAALARRDQGLAGEEEARLHHPDVAAAAHRGERGRQVALLHEAEAQDQPEKTFAEVGEVAAPVLLDIRHVLDDDGQ